MEPILQENPARFSLFPIKHKDIWEAYEHAIASFWTVDEIDFSQDKKDWVKLNDNEKYFIKNILSFFANSDSVVNENLVLNFYKEVQMPEMRQFYAAQIMMESIHAHTYNLMIETYVENEAEKLNLFNAIENNPIVKKKADWAIKWITNGTFAERLIAFAVVEGIFFSGSFCAIFWLKNRGILPGLTLSNEFISRDESLHCNGAILLYNYLENKLPEERIVEIFKDAVKIEKEFITESLPVRLIGMNSELMCQYIEFVADYWITKLGYSKIYGSENPFDFMNYISLQNFGNFFETKISSYRKANVGVKQEDTLFSMDADF